MAADVFRSNQWTFFDILMISQILQMQISGDFVFFVGRSRDKAVQGFWLCANNDRCLVGFKMFVCVDA